MQRNKRYVRYPEGAEMYSMSVSKFMQIAKDAKACYKVNQLVLVNLDIIDEYLETFHIVDDEFYKQVKRKIEKPARMYLTFWQTTIKMYLDGGVQWQEQEDQGQKNRQICVLLFALRKMSIIFC